MRQFTGSSSLLSQWNLSRKKGGLVGHTTFICRLLVLIGKDRVKNFESTLHFHNTLTLIYGHNVAGTLARTQKLCNPLQLSFRNGGRPQLKNKDIGERPVS